MDIRLVLGVVLLGLAGLLWWSAGRAQARHRRLLVTETLDAATLAELHRTATAAAGPGAFRIRVDLEGTAAAGPGGPLRSPLTDTPCVWHHHRVTRKHEVEVTGEDGKRRTEARDETVAEQRSDQPFGVADAGGTTTVEPGPAGVDGARQVLDEYDDAPGPGGTLGHRRQEWVLTAGTPVFVSGEAYDGPSGLVVGAPTQRGDRYVLTTRSQEQVLTATAASDRRLRIAAAVSAGLGVVLLVLGALS